MDPKTKKNIVSILVALAAVLASIATVAVLVVVYAVNDNNAWDIGNNKEWPTIKIDSPFQVFAVDDEGGCNVPQEKIEAMKASGFVKVVCPFEEILIAGSESYSNEFLLFGANVLANILDQDSDGAVDDPAILQFLSYRNSKGGALLACGTNQDEEVAPVSRMPLGTFDLGVTCNTHYGFRSYGGSIKNRLTTRASTEYKMKGIMIEQAFHMIHNQGYANLYPDELGINNYTSSVIGRETARLQCVQPGWIHPWNDECPEDSPREVGNPAPSTMQRLGAGMDIEEFYKTTMFLLNGMGENFRYYGKSEYMPSQRDDVMGMLSDEFKDMIGNPSLHQLNSTIMGIYPVVETARALRGTN